MRKSFLVTAVLLAGMMIGYPAMVGSAAAQPRKKSLRSRRNANANPNRRSDRL